MVTDRPEWFLTCQNQRDKKNKKKVQKETLLNLFSKPEL